jgi:hypothetical protein
MRDLRAFVHDPIARVCLALIVLAAPLPFINIGSLPFWADESIAILPAHNIHRDLLPTSPYDLDVMPWQLKWGLWDPATPLYRYTVAGFTALTGFSEATARCFSVLMGLATAIPFYALVRALYGRRTALLAAPSSSPRPRSCCSHARHGTSRSSCSSSCARSTTCTERAKAATTRRARSGSPFSSPLC